MTISIRFPVGLLLVMVTTAAVAVAGCATTDDGRTAAQRIEDTVIISRVRAALLGAEEIDGTRIEVEVVRGKVQLAGVVDTEAERDAAARITREAEGVRSVENNLELEQAASGARGPAPTT